MQGRSFQCWLALQLPKGRFLNNRDPKTPCLEVLVPPTPAASVGDAVEEWKLRGGQTWAPHHQSRDWGKILLSLRASVFWHKYNGDNDVCFTNKSQVLRGTWHGDRHTVGERLMSAGICFSS